MPVFIDFDLDLVIDLDNPTPVRTPTSNVLSSNFTLGNYELTWSPNMTAGGGQYGTGSHWSLMDMATPLVTLPAVPILLKAPAMFDNVTGFNDMLQHLPERHTTSITGIDWSGEALGFGIGQNKTKLIINKNGYTQILKTFDSEQEATEFSQKLDKVVTEWSNAYKSACKVMPEEKKNSEYDSRCYRKAVLLSDHGDYGCSLSWTENNNTDEEFSVSTSTENAVVHLMRQIVRGDHQCA